MNLLRAIGLVFLTAVNVWGQEFDAEVFQSYQTKIDSFYADEDYQKLKPALTHQINYLQSTGRIDSLYLYVYKVGRSYARTEGLDKAVEEVEGLINIISSQDPDTSHILSAINDLSWTYYEAGKDSLCLQNDLRFLELCYQYVNATPKERSDAHYNVGFDYQAMGNTAKAIEHFELAIIPVKNDTVKYLKKRMDCYNALGAAYWRNGEMAKAKEALKISNDLSALLEDTVQAKLFQANAIGNLSLIYEDEANLAKSMELLEKSIELRKEALPYLEETYDRDLQTRHLISNYHNLSALYLTIGDLERAIAMTEFVDQLQKDFYPPDHSVHFRQDEAKGSLQLAAKNYPEAEKLLQSSLEGALFHYGNNSYYTATGHQRLGELYSEWGKFDQAIYHLNQTIQVALSINDEFSSQELARAYQLRAEVRSARGDLVGAKRDLIRSKNIYAATRGERSSAVGNIYLDLAILHMNQNQADSANFYLDNALALFEENRKGNQFGEKGNYRGIVRRLPEAYLLKAQWNASEDEQEIKESLGFLDQALQYLRTERRNFEGDGSQLSFIDEYSSVYSEAAKLAFRLFEITGNESYKESVLRYAEERKTVLLKRRLNKFSSLRVADIPDSLIVAEEMLLSKLSDPELKGEYAEIESEYDELLSILKKDYPSYFDLRYDSKTATIEDIQSKILKGNQSLVEYIDVGESYLVLVITKENAELLSIEKDDFEEEIDHFNSAIQERDLDSVNSRSRELRKTLFDPVIRYLAGHEIFIIPDGSLYALNFEALATETGFLIEDYTISFLLSSTTALLYGKLEDARSGQGALALAPGFENGENRGDFGERFIRQPFAMRTAEMVGEVFSGLSLTASAASEERFKEEAEQYRIIHLGTHTEINVNSPMLSRLILSRTDQEDGYLHAYELYNLPLRAELAVLTACETGVGKESASEGVLSMAHGFAYAGCPSLIMSLWEIDEKTSAAIMENFYENLAGGMAKNQAIRQAKMDYLLHAQGELKNPYYWSGLVLFGDVSPVEQGSNHLLLLLILPAFAVFFFLLKRKSKKSSL